MSEVVYGDEEYENFLAHVGTPHQGTIPHSGRYEYGSGDNPFQREVSFRRELVKMRQQGLSDDEIMKAMGMKSTEFRQMVSISKDRELSENIARAKELSAKGYSNTEIAKIMGMPASSENKIRYWLKQDGSSKMKKTNDTADFLREQMKIKKYIDVGDGTELVLSDALGFPITSERRDTALKLLEMEGYEVINIRLQQATNWRQKTTIKVLAPAGTIAKDIYNNLDDIKSIEDYETVSEMTSLGIRPPTSFDSKRLAIRYRDEGGIDKDGVIELRRGVNEISLGGANYAQVRIMVDGTHYLKGMAVYSDDLPDGVDIMFNTNKTPDVPVMGPKDNTILKPIKKDPANPFGATITLKGQRDYTGADGEQHLSPVNILKEEGTWADYSKTLSSQFLSKQPIELIKRQLNLAYSERKDEFDEIMSMTNPAVRKKLLADFAENCDSGAVYMRAAALPRQATQVILPLTTIKENEVYAPQYKNGEEVCLIRFPHEGVFQIPQLRVNNKNKEGISAIGSAAKDAIGISAKVAEQLSGADFDGDTVMVIPVNDKVKITHKALLDGLVGYDPKITYKGYPGMKVISGEMKQKQMGVVSNLITDMTIQGADSDELTRAVKFSMCIIDAEKHELDYKRCYKEQDIEGLKKKYQEGGASTIISRAKSPVAVPERKLQSIERDADPKTGELGYRETGRTYQPVKVDKKTGEKTFGDPVIATQDSSRMAEAKDANDLVSSFRHPKELEYANYANKLKALGNTARKEYLATPNTSRNSSATATYASEVSSLYAKLNNAIKNSPRERQAQVVANSVIKLKLKEDPDMSKSDKKKLKQQAIAAARVRFGANKHDVQVSITPREWEAIQAGAISNNKLMQILDNADMDKVRELAMPKNDQAISSGKQARIKNMIRSGYTPAEIAEAVGVSVSTVNKYTKGA